MTIAELEQSQTEIIEEIYSFAERVGLSNDNVEPIPDGVYSVEKYLSAPTQVMWILKEPHDDFDENGEPYGGGWNLFAAYDNDDAWSQRTWQPIIYAMYGLFNNQKWVDMDEIRNNKSMADVLKQIANINVSKMPALKATNDSSLWKKYDMWKVILTKQIAIYTPKIIIFGNTFRYFKNDLIGADIKPIKSIDGIVDIYEKADVRFLDTYHPNQKMVKRCDYVNSIIKACL
jgi:hypothetical protein